MPLCPPEPCTRPPLLPNLFNLDPNVQFQPLLDPESIVLPGTHRVNTLFSHLQLGNDKVGYPVLVYTWVTNKLEQITELFWLRLSLCLRNGQNTVLTDTLPGSA